MKCAVAGGLDLLKAPDCLAFWVRRLHPAGGRCPDCGVSLDGRQAETFGAGGRVHCNSCGRWFSYRTGTILAGSTADDCQLFLLAYLTGLLCSVQDIAAACRLSKDTVRAWQRRFREASR